jgi:hypothetical protein
LVYRSSESHSFGSLFSSIFLIQLKMTGSVK